MTQCFGAYLQHQQPHVCLSYGCCRRGADLGRPDAGHPKYVLPIFLCAYKQQSPGKESVAAGIGAEQAALLQVFMCCFQISAAAVVKQQHLEPK